VALTLYSMLPILRNTVAGIEGVDPALVEAARGVGMTPGQRLRRVELPLAMPVVVAGLRTATVWVTGTATLSTPVGATSLGNYIFSGLQTRNFDAVLVGCVAAAALALLLDAIIRTLERGLRERRRGRTVAALVALLALVAWTAGAFVLERAGAVAAPLRIGSKTFTEQYVLSEIVARRVARATGRPAEALQSLGSTVLFDALREGDIDLYVDYSGTIWATLMKRETLPGDRARVLQEVKAWLREEHGIELLAPLGFENTYALAMREDRARALGVHRIDELRPAAPRLVMGGDYEFFGRPEWAAIRDAYGLDFADLRAMDPALMYRAVASGDVDVISAFSTDGRIAAFDLRVLEDDRGVIPPYDAILMGRPGLAQDAPAAVAALRDLSGAIDAEAMRRMNLAVDREGRSPAAVARDFLDAWSPPGGAGPAPPPAASPEAGAASDATALSPPGA
jgi:osmoprotectant transport system permease protein